MMTEPQALTTIEFPVGLPGFPEAGRFEIQAWGDGAADNPFFMLQCVDDPDLAFVACNPMSPRRASRCAVLPTSSCSRS